jgi:hypothetical protein
MSVNNARNATARAENTGWRHLCNGNTNLSLQIKNTSKRQRSQVVYLADGRIAGTVTSERFEKRVQDKHQLQKPPAWCCDVSVLHEAERLGATQVWIKNVETGMSYYAPLAVFWQRGITINRGFGAQIALPLAFWAVVEEPQADMTQLSLFGGVL